MLNVDDLIRSCQAVVFDCADTLLRLDPPREVIFRDAAAEAGLELQLDDVARAYELVDFAVKIKSSELRSVAVKSEFYRAYNAALCAALGIVQSMGALNSSPDPALLGTPPLGRIRRRGRNTAGYWSSACPSTFSRTGITGSRTSFDRQDCASSCTMWQLPRLLALKNRIAPVSMPF